MKTPRKYRDSEIVKGEQSRKAKRKHCAKPTYKITPFSSTGKKLVRLNAKTEAWVLPGTDIAALKVKLKIKD